MFTALILSAVLISDTLYLQDGTAITGKITTVTEDSVTIGDLTFPRSQVSRFTITTVSPKSPAFALVMSLLVPGAGYFYVGDDGAGAFFLVSEIALLGWAAVAAQGDVDHYAKTGESRNTWIAPFLGAVSLRVIELVGSPIAALRYNRAHGLTLQCDPDRISIGYALICD